MYHYNCYICKVFFTSLHGRLCRSDLIRPVLSEIDTQEYYQRHNEYDGRKRKQTRSDTDLYLAVYKRRYGIYSCSPCEVSDDEIINRHGKAEEEARHYPGLQFRQYDLAESISFGSSEIERRFKQSVGVFIHTRSD